MIEVNLKEKDDFLLIKETLTRIGIANRHKKKLYQSCHILHNDGRYFIAHFKQLLAMELGKEIDYEEDDKDRLNVIVNLLREWGLCEPINELKLPEEKIVLTILPHKEKDEWELIQKFSLGGIKNEDGK